MDSPSFLVLVVPLGKGVPEARQPKAVELPEVLDDLDWDYEESYEEASKGVSRLLLNQ